MARVKGAVHAKKHHRAILEQAQGYYGNKSRSFRAANEQVMHSMQYAYRDRRARKGDFRQLWIQRINAAARLNGHELQPVHRRAPPRRASRSTARSWPTWPSRDPRRSPPWCRWPTTRWPSPECRGRFLTQPGLAFTHQRVRRVRQLLRKRSLRGREGAGGRGRRAAVGGPRRRACRSSRSTWHPRGATTRRAGDPRRWSPCRRCGSSTSAPGVIERVADTVTPQPRAGRGVAAGPAPSRRSRRRHLVVVCVDVRDPGNAGHHDPDRRRRRGRRGGLLRRDGRPDQPEDRAGLGRLDLPRAGGGRGSRRTRCSTELGERGFARSATVVRGGTDYATVRLARPVALVFGNEASGTRRRSGGHLDAG